MSYIKIEKTKLVNLEYTLNKELIRANGTGAYAGSTLSGCNTRKYHGLLVAPLKNDERHVLLANVSETIVQHDKEFRLGIYKFSGGVYHPHGHRYLREFHTDPIPTSIYRVGGVVLQKEMLLVQNEKQVLLRYTLLEANSSTKLRLQPALAFRNIHDLKRAGMSAKTKVVEIQNGIKSRLYDGYPDLWMQTSRKPKFVAAPDWLYNVEYQEEQNRGYEFTEDLFVPGYFEVDVKVGQSIVFSAGLDQVASGGLSRKFETEVLERVPRNTFENNLLNSAHQFFIKEGKDTSIIGGFYWYGFEFREALLSLSGLTLYQNDTKLFEDSLDTILRYFYKKIGELPSDIALLLIRVIQQYMDYADDKEVVWKKYGKDVTKVIKTIHDGKFVAKMHENGLLYIPDDKPFETWMNESVDGVPVTSRTGYVVEINALWYNSVMFADAMAKQFSDIKLAGIIKKIPTTIAESFQQIFANNNGRHLNDFVNESGVTTDSRPNQLYALALPYSPLPDKDKLHVLESIEDHLLTERGLRTLSPRNAKFIQIPGDNENSRKLIKHQGLVYPWLFALYAEAKLKMFGNSAIYEITKRYVAFESQMHEDGLGTISELYSPNPPHRACGAVSYAPSVAALLNVKMLLDKYNNESNKA